VRSVQAMLTILVSPLARQPMAIAKRHRELALAKRIP
jgi:hypothetical protein